MNTKKQHHKLVRTKRNKNLEPLFTGIGVIGYDREIHDEDSLEFKYRLPLGAIKRLIISYYEDIKMFDEEWVYLATSSSSGLRITPYCYRMLGDIEKQLDKRGFNGKEIIREVFDRYFKKDYEKMNLYSKNHKNQDPMNYKPCNDPICCEPKNKN
jgi:hypothetical protein